MAINISIKRLCQLVEQINAVNKNLDKQAEHFYDGGNTFEESNKYEIDILVELQEEFLLHLDILNGKVIL